MKKALSICLVCALILQLFVGLPTAYAENVQAPANSQQVSENDEILTGWQSMAMGAGGQTQGVTVHEGVPGTMYYCSDMEGAYVSHDYGENWHWIGEQINNGCTFKITGMPYDEKTVFLGSVYGLQISKDGGKTWQYMNGTNLDGTKNDVTFPRAINTITVNPYSDGGENKEYQTVYAAPGWHIKKELLQLKSLPQQEINDTLEIYASFDGGVTWQTIVYDEEAGKSRNAQVFDVVVDESDKTGKTVWLSANNGIYKSIDRGLNWRKLDAPTDLKLSVGDTTFAGQQDMHSFGMDITDDGKYGVAVFSTNVDNNDKSLDTNASHKDITGLYLLNTETEEWTRLEETGVNRASMSAIVANSVNNLTGCWVYPDIKSNDDGSFEVLVGCFYNRGFMMGEISVADNGDVSEQWGTIFDNTDGVNYDLSWNGVDTQVRQFQWIPEGWSSEADMDYEVYMASQQMAYLGKRVDNDNDGEIDDWFWNCVSTKQVGESKGEGKYTTYTSPGVQCTYNYNTAAYKNYALQGMGDNGLLESWDYGYSWVEESRTLNKGVYDYNTEDGINTTNPDGLNQAMWSQRNGFAMEVIPYNEYYAKDSEKYAEFKDVAPVVTIGGCYGFGGATWRDVTLGWKFLENLDDRDLWEYDNEQSAVLRVNPETKQEEYYMASGFRINATQGADGKKVLGTWPVPIYDIDYDKEDPNIVYVSTQEGVYITEHFLDGITNGWNETNRFNKVVKSQYNSANTVDIDPNDNNVIYAMNKNQSNPEVANVTKYTRVPGKTIADGTALYEAQVVTREATGTGTGNCSLGIWDNNGTTYVSYATAEGVFVSDDGCKTVRKVLDTDQYTDIHWEMIQQFNVDNNIGARIQVEATTGSGNLIFANLSYEHNEWNRGYGMIYGVIAEDGTISWFDFTGSLEDDTYMEYAHVHRLNIEKVELSDGTVANRLMAATAGCSLWSIDVPANVNFDNISNATDINSALIKGSHDKVNLTLVNHDDVQEILPVAKNGIVYFDDAKWDDHCFTGWYIDENCLVKYDGGAITKDTTLYAGWVPAYKVSFDTNGGNDIDNIFNPAYEKIAVDVEAQKADSVFIGWFKDAELHEVWDMENDIVTEDTTLYAKYRTEYKVDFSVWPGTGVPQAQYIGANGKVELPDVIPVAADKIFAGWKVRGGPWGQLYDFNSTVTSSMTLIAHWTEAPVKTEAVVTYVFDDVTFQSQTYSVGDKFTNMPNKERVNPETGKTEIIVGWGANVNGKWTTFEENVTAVPGKIYLIADWKPGKKVTFDPNNGEEPIVMYVKDGEIPAVPEVVAPDGKGLRTWTTDGKFPTYNAANYNTNEGGLGACDNEYRIRYNISSGEYEFAIAPTENYYYACYDELIDIEVRAMEVEAGVILDKGLLLGVDTVTKGITAYIPDSEIYATVDTDEWYIVKEGNKTEFKIQGSKVAGKENFIASPTFDAPSSAVINAHYIYTPYEKPTVTTPIDYKTVTYLDEQGGNELGSVKVGDEKTIAELANYSNEANDQIVYEWHYIDADGVECTFVEGKTFIGDDMELFAVWGKGRKITFDHNNGKGDFTYYYLKPNEIPEMPEVEPATGKALRTWSTTGIVGGEEYATVDDGLKAFANEYRPRFNVVSGKYEFYTAPTETTYKAVYGNEIEIQIRDIEYDPATKTATVPAHLSDTEHLLGTVKVAQNQRAFIPHLDKVPETKVVDDVEYVVEWHVLKAKNLGNPIFIIKPITKGKQGVQADINVINGPTLDNVDHYLFPVYVEAKTLTYDLGDGTESQEIKVGKTMPYNIAGMTTAFYTPGTPTRDGYVFQGWYEVGATEPFNFASTTDENDHSIEARWQSEAGYEDANTFIEANKAVLDLTIETVTVEDQTAIETAKTAYEALSEEAQAFIQVDFDSLLAKIEDLQIPPQDPFAPEIEKYKESQAYALGLTEVTLKITDKSYIEKAIVAMNLLSDGAKEQLTAEKATFDALLVKVAELEEGAEVDLFKTQYADELAMTVETVAITDKTAIETAQTAYEELSEKAQTEITQIFDTLLDKIAELEAAAALVEEVSTYNTNYADELALTMVTVAITDKTAIETAQTAYEALSDEAKAQITVIFDALLEKIAELEEVAEKETALDALDETATAEEVNTAVEAVVKANADIAKAETALLVPADDKNLAEKTAIANEINEKIDAVITAIKATETSTKDDAAEAKAKIEALVEEVEILMKANVVKPEDTDKTTVTVNDVVLSGLGADGETASEIESVVVATEIPAKANNDIATECKGYTAESSMSISVAKATDTNSILVATNLTWSNAKDYVIAHWTVTGVEELEAVKVGDKVGFYATSFSPYQVLSKSNSSGSIYVPTTGSGETVEPTVTPEPTVKPVETAKPEPTVKPVETVKPAATTAPVTTQAPTTTQDQGSNAWIWITLAVVVLGIVGVVIYKKKK